MACILNLVVLKPIKTYLINFILNMRRIVFLFMLFIISSIQSQDWQNSFQVSIKKAQDENKKLIVVFQGSDWCGPCIRLTQQVFSTNHFINYSDKAYVLLQVDFPRRKKNSLSKPQQDANNILAEKYNPNGYFPYVVVLDKNGKFLGDLGYENTTPEQYIKLIESF